MEWSLVAWLMWLTCGALVTSVPLLPQDPQVPQANLENVTDERTVAEIIQEANKELNAPVFDADIRFRFYRSGKDCTKCLWTKSSNGMVYVPFVISPVFTSFERSLMFTAMKEFETMTCVRFVNRIAEPDFINIDNQINCWSYVGKVGGQQTVSINMPICMKLNLIQHEFMHTLGFYHEHTRRDRDNYVEIQWQNIPPENELVFKLDDGNIQNMPYDYTSIMHYSIYSFSKGPGLPSMLPKPDPSVSVGQAIGLNDMDIMKINLLYNCDLCSKKLIAPGSLSFDSTLLEKASETCLYLFQSSLKVLLQITNVKIPSSTNCNDAYIKVYDGVSTSSPVLLDKTCGNAQVPPLVSSGNFILVEIGKSQPLSMITFSATYEKVRYGNTLLTDDDIVSSPGFPSFYPNNIDALYSIIAPQKQTVSLVLQYFMVGSLPPCKKDFLIIRDGPSLTSEILGKFCGIVNPYTVVTSTGNVMVLHFHSGENKGYNGFTANYYFVPMR